MNDDEDPIERKRRKARERQARYRAKKNQAKIRAAHAESQ